MDDSDDADQIASLPCYRLASSQPVASFKKRPRGPKW